MARHLRITGIVQGVGYRASFAQMARTLHLSGWVRNRRDGSVEVLVTGDADAVEKIIAWAWQGPASAQVEDVAIAAADDAQVTSGTFQTLPTV